MYLDTAELLRSVAEQHQMHVTMAGEMDKQRDALILQLRSEINPATRKRWTWEQIAEMAELSRMGAFNASKRAAARQIEHRKSA
ncbi:hypothetical protein [Nocardia niwae]|uniref:hypothetical protein n=1 Tax=Nocardia niwae TaxID=626084 RepID=UPI0012F4B3CA|nr:hypothetical protein [Nocardia niwae]